VHEVDIFRNWQVLDPENFCRPQTTHWRKLPCGIFVPLAAARTGSIIHPAGSPAWAISGNLGCPVLSLLPTALRWAEGSRN